MCRVESNSEERESRRRRRWWKIGMGVKVVVCDDNKKEKSKSSSASNIGGGSSRSKKIKLWMVRATTSVLLWTCIVNLTTFGEVWGPKVLKGWPSCFSQDSPLDLKLSSTVSVPPRVLPPKSEFFFKKNSSVNHLYSLKTNCGYLQIYGFCQCFE